MLRLRFTTFKTICGSRLGWLLVAVHFYLVFLAFCPKSAQTGQETWVEFQKEYTDYILIAGRGVHIGIESDFFLTLTSLDAPTLVVGLLVTGLLTPFYSNLSAVTASWIDAVVLLFFTSLQWILVGHIIELSRVVKQITGASWFKRIRTIAAWSVIPAAALFFIAQYAIVIINPQGYGPWSDALLKPARFGVWIMIRNIFLLIAVIAGFLGLPKKRAIVSLGFTLFYFGFVYWLFYNHTRVT